MARVLSQDEARARARRLRLVLSDVDGVLTDAGVYYSEAGEALKRFSLRDGMGVERLREAGVETAFLTRERSPIVERRVEKLKLARSWHGVRDKRAALEAILGETGLTLEQLGYIGDDVNDLGIIQAIAERGLTAAPADGMPEVKDAVAYVASERGGHGAFRDFAEWILRMRTEGSK